MARAATGTARRTGTPARGSHGEVAVESAQPTADAASEAVLPLPPGTDTAQSAYIPRQDPLLAENGSPIEVESLIFDPRWYMREYPDVAAAGVDPVRHFFDNGFRENRNPNSYFDTKWYASNNPDVGAAGLNPFLHYLFYGAREGRKPAP